MAQRKIIVLVESSRAAGRDLLRGIARYAHHHGPWSFYWRPAGFEKTAPELEDLEPDGVILRDFEVADEVIRRGLPVVIIEHSRGVVPGVANVVTDSAAIGQMAAEHLLSCGFKQFAFCGYQNCSWSDARWDSFQNCLQHTGCSADAFAVRTLVWTVAASPPDCFPAVSF